MHSLYKELTIAQELAIYAGKLIIKLQKKIIIQQKPNNEGPVTNADLLADEFICNKIKQKFPNDNIISEESYKSNILVPQKGRVWWVDPIDGTSDYINNGKDYAVMIGLNIDNIPRLGVVYQPTTNFIWIGVINKKEKIAQKIFNNNEIKNLNTITKNNVKPKHFIIISNKYSSLFINDFIKKFKISTITKKGSFGLKIALIAESIADLYITHQYKTKLWDICAPAAILIASGGKLRAIDNNKITKTPLHNFFCAMSPNLYEFNNSTLYKKLKQITKSYNFII